MSALEFNHQSLEVAVIDSFSWTRPPEPGETSSTYRTRNAPLPAELVRRIVQLDVDGLSRVAICERLGVCDETVRKYLRQAGRPIKLVGMAVVKARGR